MGLADVVEAYRPKVVRVRVCPRNDLVGEYDRLAQDYGKPDGSLAGASGAGRLHELQTEIAASSVEFVFQGLPRRAWSDLLGKHQPKQRHRDQFGIDYNPDTFPPAAMAASLAEPRGDSDAETAELVRRIFDEWHEGEIEKLWLACLQANKGVSQVPFSWGGSDATAGSATRSEPPSD